MTSDNKLINYKASFVGRLVGAIGISYPITIIIKATNKDQARLNLYKNYEHIKRLLLEKG